MLVQLGTSKHHSHLLKTYHMFTGYIPLAEITPVEPHLKFSSPATRMAWQSTTVPIGVVSVILVASMAMGSEGKDAETKMLLPPRNKISVMTFVNNLAVQFWRNSERRKRR